MAWKRKCQDFLLHMMLTCVCAAPSEWTLPLSSSSSSLSLSGMLDEVVSSWQVLPWLCVYVCVCARVRAWGHIGPGLQSMAGTKPQGRRCDDISFPPSPSALLTLCYPPTNRSGCVWAWGVWTHILFLDWHTLDTYAGWYWEDWACFKVWGLFIGLKV